MLRMYMSFKVNLGLGLGLDHWLEISGQPIIAAALAAAGACRGHVPLSFAP